MPFYDGPPLRSALRVLFATMMLAAGGMSTPPPEENVPQALGGSRSLPETPTAGTVVFGGFGDLRMMSKSGDAAARSETRLRLTGKLVSHATVDAWDEENKQQLLLPSTRQHAARRNGELGSSSGYDNRKAVDFAHRQLQLTLCESYVDTAGNTLCPAGSAPVGNDVSCGVGAVCNDGTCCEGASTSAPTPSSTHGPSAGPSLATSMSSTPGPSSAPSSSPTEAPRSGPSPGSPLSGTSRPSPTSFRGSSEEAGWEPSPGPAYGPTSPGPTPAPSPGPILTPSLGPVSGPHPAPSSRPIAGSSPDPATSRTPAPSPAPVLGSAPNASPTPPLGPSHPSQTTFPGATGVPDVAFIPTFTPRDRPASSPAPTAKQSPGQSPGITPSPSPAPSPASASQPSPALASSSTPESSPAPFSGPAAGQSPSPSPGPTRSLSSRPDITPSPSLAPPSWPIQEPLPGPSSSPTPRPSTPRPSSVTPPDDSVAPIGTMPLGGTLSPEVTLVPILGMEAPSTKPTSTSATEATVTPIDFVIPASSSTPERTLSPELTSAPSGEKVSAPVLTTTPVSLPSSNRTLRPSSTWAPTASLPARDPDAPFATFEPGATLPPGATRAPGIVAKLTTPAPASSLVPGATFAPIDTRAPEPSLSPGETWAPNLAEELPTLPSGPTSAPRTNVGPMAPIAPEASTAPVNIKELPTSAPGSIVVDTAVEKPGSTAAGAVSIIALIGLLIVSTGSIIRSNQIGNSSVPSVGEMGGSSADGFHDVPVGAPMGRTSDERKRRHASHRRPAATLAFVLMTQLQFLAMLSLVDYTVSQDSLLADFVLGLRWANLWWSAEFAKDVASEGCIFEAGASNISGLIFVGNLTLVTGTLFGVFFVHVTVVSGVEALWLTKKRARANLDAARRRAVPNSELRARFRGGRGTRRTIPCLAEPNRPDTQAVEASRDVSPLEESFDDSGEEEGGRALVPMISESLLNPVAACRDFSSSAWLHFPHVELVFLFFAYEGAVASFASAMKNSECPETFYTAVAAMVLYPLLMFVTVFRTVLVRVRPDTLLIFRSYHDGSVDGDTSSTLGGFLARLKSSWTTDYSIFTWADKGHWETVQTPNRQVTREGDWFRIGFEPVFADYTKRGAWFVVISLTEAASIAMIGVLVDDSVVQLLLLGGLHSVMFVVLVCLKPFANSAINNIGALSMAIDSFSMGLLGVAALKWEGTTKAEQANTVVVVLQLFSLCALAIPVYLDAGTILAWAIFKRIRKTLSMNEHEMTRKDREARAYIRIYICRHLFGTWCTMIRHNVFACARDTSEGVRKPRLPTASRSGPYPVVDPTTLQGHSNGGLVRAHCHPN